MTRRRSLRLQLREAYEAAHQSEGLTLIELIGKAGLECSESSLYRKLFEEQTLRSDEVEKLAKALRVEVTAGRSEAA
jgi:hypothetical protein